jgi:hypothetical protein
MFLELGRTLGLDVRRIYRPSLPTDGVWLVKSRFEGTCDLPLVAMEVPVTESPKTLRGSIATLEAVSPALAFVVVNEEEIRRRLIAQGESGAFADTEIIKIRGLLEEAVSRSKHRFSIWSIAYLSGIYKRFTGKKSVHRALVVRAAPVLGECYDCDQCLSCDHVGGCDAD